jgi:hypothetical protein
MKIQSIEARLKKIDRERDRLSRQLETSKAKYFGAIPSKYGYRSMDALIGALAPYASPRLKSRLGNGGTLPKAAGQRSTVRTGRNRYTERQKAAVKGLLAKGGKTVPQIAKETRVAATSIIDWKKKWGLVKKRRPARKK